MWISITVVEIRFRSTRRKEGDQTPSFLPRNNIAQDLPSTSMWCHRSIGAGHDRIAIALRGISAGSLECHRLSLPEPLLSEITESTLFWITGTSGGSTTLLGPLDHHHLGPPENQRSHHRQGSKYNVCFTGFYTSCSRTTPTNQAQ